LKTLLNNGCAVAVANRIRADREVLTQFKPCEYLARAITDWNVPMVRLLSALCVLRNNKRCRCWPNEEIVAAARRYAPDAAIDGVLVQEMVRDAVEVIVGVNNDPLFGPAVMFGLGGIFTEILHDVAFRLAPLTRSTADEMIRQVKGYPLLAGARGRPACDVDALAQAICQVSALALDLSPHLAELDINPLFVLPQGRGVKAGDALIKPRLQQAAPEGQ
jgi:acyl-CoA synthetase (NDP forming)